MTQRRIVYFSTRRAKYPKFNKNRVVYTVYMYKYQSKYMRNDKFLQKDKFLTFLGRNT